MRTTIKNEASAPSVNGFAELKNKLQKTNDLAEALQTDVSLDGGQTSRTEQVPEDCTAQETKVKAHAPAPVVKTKKVLESGINVTLANAQKLNTRIATMSNYGSNNPLLTPAALVTLYELAMSAVSNLRKLRNGYKKTLKVRYALYMQLLPFATRVVNELKASGVPVTTISRARGIIKKMRGQRVIAIKANERDKKHISACQTSFENKLAFYAELIELVADEPLYDPMTDDLKTVALEVRYNAMATANTDCDGRYADQDMAMQERNRLFNAPSEGLVDVYLAAKFTVLAIYGASSGEYKMVKGLRFDRIKD